MKLLGDSIRSAREIRQMTQVQLCKKAGISQSYLSEIERGENQPTALKLFELARALDMHIDFFVPTEFKDIVANDQTQERLIRGIVSEVTCTTPCKLIIIKQDINGD